LQNACPLTKNGVRIAQLSEMSFRKKLWAHEPLTDFWQVGPGISKKLIKNGMFTMGDVARQSVKNEDLLYKLFGKKRGAPHRPRLGLGTGNHCLYKGI
jgi:DNA polymerase V